MDRWRSQRRPESEHVVVREKEPEGPDHALIEELSLLEPAGDSAKEPPPIDASQLEAYRRGELDDEEATALERRLAHDEQARARLVSLAGESLPAPSPFLRARVLRAFGQGKPAAPERAQGSTRRRWAPMLVAAVLVLSLAGILLRDGTGGHLPPELTYQVSVRGLAEVRSEGTASSDRVEVFAETPLELTVAPEGLAEGDVDFAVYRLADGGWLRVATSGEAELEAGSAIFKQPARMMLGDVPGDYQLLVAIARPGQLAERLGPGDLENPGDRYRLHRLTVRLLP